MPALYAPERAGRGREMLKKVLAATAVAVALVMGTSLAGFAAPTAAVGPPPRAKGFATVSPWQAKALVETRPGLVIIDVRSPEEYMKGALPGSYLVPFWDAMKGKIVLPPETPLLLVCAVGGRSLAVGRYLEMKGFAEVYNLKGGLEAWVGQRVPLPKKPR